MRAVARAEGRRAAVDDATVGPDGSFDLACIDHGLDNPNGWCELRLDFDEVGLNQPRTPATRVPAEF